MALDFDAYLLSDTNPDSIGLYQILKQETQSFIDFAYSFFIPKNNQEIRFYELREQFNASNDLAERAALFVYLNRHAFNGLCRYNSKGKFNVPFGRYRTPYFPLIEMQQFIQKAHRIELMCGDFQAALDLVQTHDMVYCDPPYVPLSETASFTAYAKNGFGASEQTRLASSAKNLINLSNGILSIFITHRSWPQ